LLFFFFQAEDGIRDFHVTGVQTCALPICWYRCDTCGSQKRSPCSTRRARVMEASTRKAESGSTSTSTFQPRLSQSEATVHTSTRSEERRCRERVQISAVAAALKEKSKRTT